MRDVLQAHAPAFTATGAMLLVALIMGTAIEAAVVSEAPSVLGPPGPPIPLPSPAEDRDLDSYGDGIDRVAGNRMLRVNVTHLDVGDGLPYLLVGTQDDHWRLGADRALEWPHIVDGDPLGRSAGSPSWKEAVVRTGAWWMSIPQEGASKAIHSEGTLTPDTEADGVLWPQAFWLDVREDQAVLDLTIELYDATPDPDRRVGTWDLSYDAEQARWRSGDAWHGDGQAAPLGRSGAGLTLAIEERTGLEADEAQAIAERWAPTLHFAAGERFFPMPGQTLQQFHGFAKQTPDLRTWTRDFTNGRDAYLLFLADFDGDRDTDHEDAAIMTDVLSVGGLAPPTVYHRTHMTTGDQVVVQYWFVYAYNFVRDEGGDDIGLLAHNGDREFIQLTFPSVAAAQNGTPSHIAYSQHYRGIQIPYDGDAAPWQGTHPDVYVARGSHASYPVPGDDRRLRRAFVAYGDVFDGQGDVWAPGNYTLEAFAAQPWHAGYLWGPVTRHSRDLGTASKPLLQHTFRYPYIDPVPWQLGLNELAPDELDPTYGELP